MAAPAGSGKTTLVSSYIRQRTLPCIWYQCDEGDADLSSFFYYMAVAAQKANPRRKTPLPLLTPEYLLGLPTFARRYFDELYGRLKAPCLIVLDNYQVIPAASPLHEMLVQGLEVMPAGTNMAIISRHEPPPAFARPLANNRMSLIGWNDMRFTIEETAELLNAGAPNGSLRRAASDVYEKADGWIAAIVLMLQRARLYGTEPALRGTFDFDSEETFDYFAAEIFGKTDAETRDFLLKTAVLPTINVSLAEQLTNRDHGGRILSALSRQNYFTQRLSGSGQNYRYHPLFRDFLLSRAASELDAVELLQIRGKAAAMLVESGQTEEAAALLAEIGDWGGLARLLAAKAKTLIVEGRNKTLETYLRKLPEQTLDASPQLLYWLGICVMPFDIEESRALLERASHWFNAAGDMEWALAAWAAIVDSIITEHNDYAKLDRWIDWLDGREDMLQPLSLDIQIETVAYMLFALTFRRPWHPTTGLWARMAEDLVRNSREMSGTITVGARLLPYYTFFGEVHKAELMLLNIRPPDSRKVGLRVFSLIEWQVITAVYTALGSGSPSACLDAVNSGLALSREHGIHVFDPLLLYFGAVSCVVTGNDAAADGFLAEMVSSRARFNEMQLAYYVSVLAWMDLIKGDARSAAARIGMLLPVTEKLGHMVNTIANHIGMAHALFELGEKKTALRHLAKARALHGMDSRWFEYVFLVTDAYFALKEGRETDGLALTRRAMALSRQQGVTVFVYWRPAMLSLLCNKALEAGIETDYVKGVIRKHRLEPDDSNLASERWPWPLRIYAMGRFEIFRDDVSLEFSGKTPQKPLELLKALIAFGGHNVPVETITDAVWPDADGDLAHQSFESALSRLRRLLGEGDCIKYSARQLSIDLRRCWVDSMALENILGGPESAQPERCIEIYKHAARLYKGEFLPTDASRAWVVSRNETLKNRLLRVIAEAGRLYERKGQWETAAECYQRGLHTDHFVEEFYRRLMICYHRLGRRAEAVRLYGRCRRLLQANLGIEPSPATDAVYSSILKQS